MRPAGAPDRASILNAAAPARDRGAGRWYLNGLPVRALLALPMLATPVVSFAAPAPAPAPGPGPAPGPPQSVSPPSTPPHAAPGQTKAGQPVANVAPTLSEDDELILEFRTEHREMSDTITVHGLRGGVYMPLGDLARFLDLSITISDDGHYASGWYLSPSRTLSINLRAGTINQGGKEAPLPKADFVAYNGELWVKADRLADILPIKIITDLRAQTVVVKTLEQFPFQQKLAREAARERLGNGGNRNKTPAYPRQKTPYHLFDVPIAEAELRTVGNTGHALQAESDVRASGDLLFMTARFYASLSGSNGLTATHAELGRRDPDAHMLGPLKATEFELGDVSSESMPVGLRGVAGRGLYLTNEPLEHASVFETIDFRGELQSGFEVELYRNDTLVGSTNQAINGQYEFLKVPVDFGLNVFRLVFYGPQGQRREEVRRISVGDGRLAKGEFNYNVFAVQKDKTVFDVIPHGFLKPLNYGTWREGVDLQYGLSRAITVVGSGAMYQTGGVQSWVASAGLRTGLSGYAAKLDAAIGKNGATAIEIGLAGKVLGSSMVLTQAEYGHGFVDEVRSPSDLPLRSVTNFDLSKTLPLGLRSLPLSLDFEHLVYANGQVSDTVSFHQSMTVGRVSASNVFNYSDSASTGTAASHTMAGTFDLSTFAGTHTQYRAQLSYSLGPHAGISALGGEVAHDIDPRTAIRASVSQAFTNHQTSLGVSGTRKFGPVALSFDSTYIPQARSLAFTLRLAASFGRNPLSGRLFVARPGLSNSGAVAVRAFTDTNGDGVRNDDEKTVGKVTFFTASQHVESGSDGNAVLTGIGDGNRVAVKIDAATLPDIAMAPARPGVELVARPGRIPIVDFAIQQLSDIEGSAVYADANRKHGVAGLRLNLIDSTGKRVAHTRSEGDGFVLMEQVHPGDYTLEIAPDQARNLKIKLVSDPHIHVGGKGALVKLKVVVASE